jgi:magnesium transporter
VIQKVERLQQSVETVARKDVATLRENLTVQEALEIIRKRGVGEKIVYFYVVDVEDKLAGVLPTRRLLTGALDQKISQLMVSRVVSIPNTATVLEACEAFLMYKFLAFPVVDQQRKLVGVVDVALFTGEVFDIAEKEKMDDAFEAIGFHISQVQDASPFKAFRFRFPWLLTSIATGTACALLASHFETTLAKSLILTFFLTLVLGLSESVSIQSMTLTIQALRTSKPTFQWYLHTFMLEAGAALLLGLGCATVVGIIVYLWHGVLIAALSISISILLALCGACFFGLSVPTALHALKLDPKIAAGPVTLAFTDVFTLFFYFSIASWLL